MTQYCQPLPRDVVQMMLDVAARTLCDRPGENPAQCASRTYQMVQIVRGMEPRDGLELMMAIMIFGQFNMIMDSMKDVLFGLDDKTKARAKSGIVALNRSLIGMLREYRDLRTRPVPDQAEAVKPAEIAPQDMPPCPEGDDARFQTQIADFQATVMEKMGDIMAARTRDQGPSATDPVHEGALADLMSGLAAAMAVQGGTAREGRSAA